MSKNDRRVRYTKQIIKESLLEMLLTTPYERVTVRELCQKADINRATFYSHYESLSALMEEIEYEECKDLFDLLDDVLVDEDHLVHATTMVLQFLKEHSILREIFLYHDAAGKSLSKLTWEHLNQTIERLTSSGKIGKEQAYWLVLFIIHGTKESLRHWFESDMKNEDEFINTLCLFIGSGLSAFS